MSPLPMMGIWMRGLRFTSSMSVQSASPVYIWLRVTVNGERTDAAVLQLLRQFGDDEVTGVPSQTGLHRHGRMHRLDHLA